jgi:hypothetical protein
LDILVRIEPFQWVTATPEVRKFIRRSPLSVGLCRAIASDGRGERLMFAIRT